MKQYIIMLVGILTLFCSCHNDKGHEKAFTSQVTEDFAKSTSSKKKLDIVRIPAKLRPQTPFRIFMILWRGVTDAEKGFMDYFKKRDIPVDFTIHDCGKDKGKLSGFILEIQNQKPDLVYTFGTTVTRTVAGDIHSPVIAGIPIVFNIVSSPVAANIVPTLKSSKRNITGNSHLVPFVNQIYTMKSVLPFHRLGILFNPKEKNSLIAVESLEKLTKKNNYILIKSPITLDDKKENSNQEGISQAVSKLLSQKPELIYIPSDSFIISNANLLLTVISKVKIPTFSATEGPIKNNGALMGLVSQYYNVGILAGYKAEQILIFKKSPKDIPVSTLKKFSFIINVKTARELSFTFPMSMLKFAQIVKKQ